MKITLMPGRFVRAILANATPFGCPWPWSAQVTKTSIVAARSKASRALMELVWLRRRCDAGSCVSLGLPSLRGLGPLDSRTLRAWREVLAMSAAVQGLQPRVAG
jgi:hypothetical protein